MRIKIYHNPRCRKSREALAIIEDAGETPEVIEYLNTPPSTDELDELLQKIGVEPREAMRTGEDIYKELNLKVLDLGRDALIQTMVDHPKLIERPIVVVEKNGSKKAVIARPPEKVREIL